MPPHCLARDLVGCAVVLKCSVAQLRRLRSDFSTAEGEFTEGILERIDLHRTEGWRVSGGYQCFLVEELAVWTVSFHLELLLRHWSRAEVLEGI